MLVLAACGTQQPGPSERQAAAEGPTVTIAFGGDVNLGRRQNAISARDGFDRALADVPQLREADLAIVNLESVVSAIGTSGVEKGEDASFYFRGRPEMLNVLVAAGIDAVATANNHSGDYGPDALADQARLLDAAGIAHAGSGPDQAAACAPTLVAVGELTVALVSVDATMPHFAAAEASPGTCHLGLDEPDAWRARIGPVLAEANRSAHVSLVAVHWGPNFATEPSADKRAVGRLLVELGADAVLGSSAHVLQGIEIHQGRPIVHDAGNLLFDSQEGASDSALFVLEVRAHGVVRIRFEPLVADYGFTRLAAPPERDRILTELASLSEALGTELVGDELALDPPEADAPASPVSAPARSPSTVEPAAEPPPGCAVDDVPATAQMDPVRLGALTLLGASVEPDPVRPGTLAWVESYWRVEEPTDEALWLSPRLEPTGTGDPWRGDHEPCDWAWPSSRFVPGQIYRDRAPLRPRDATGDELVLRIGVTDGSETLALSDELARIPIGSD